ncbi:MAG: class I SAM-dependent methyltransferase [Myxococcales bacterium]|nr:class I SAM-dependent methyltransferase [Myxococcales bacterium]
MPPRATGSGDQALSTAHGHAAAAELPAGCANPGTQGCPCRPDWSCDPGAVCSGGNCYGARVKVPDAAYYRTDDVQAAVAAGRLRIHEALQVAPGMTALDLGAGRGWHALRLAQRIGRGGRVYATDLQAGELRQLRHAAAELARDVTSVARVETRVCQHDRDLALDDLPAASADLGLMTLAMQLRDEAHALQTAETYFRGVARLIKPGGQFVFWQDWRRPGDLDVAGAKALFARAGFSAGARELVLEGVLAGPTWREVQAGASAYSCCPAGSSW